jgi:hypothetical protein
MDPARRREHESAVLRALCQGALDADARKRAFALLRGYSFQERMHRVVFDVLAESPGDDPRALRESLAARLTIRGFPEVDLEPFFAPPALDADRAAKSIQALLADAPRDTQTRGEPETHRPDPPSKS